MSIFKNSDRIHKSSNFDKSTITIDNNEYEYYDLAPYVDYNVKHFLKM